MPVRNKAPQRGIYKGMRDRCRQARNAKIYLVFDAQEIYEMC